MTHIPKKAVILGFLCIEIEFVTMDITHSFLGIPSEHQKRNLQLAYFLTPEIEFSVLRKNLQSPN